jgi:hypothetical protein
VDNRLDTEMVAVVAAKVVLVVLMITIAEDLEVEAVLVAIRAKVAMADKQPVVLDFPINLLVLMGKMVRAVLEVVAVAVTALMNTVPVAVELGYLDKVLAV